MPYNSSHSDIEQLRQEVLQREARESLAYDQWQIGIEEVRKRRLDQIIVEVVLEHYHHIVMSVVRQLRKLFSLE